MPEDTPQPAKPGTACLGCRRRKLICSREQGGCNNCTKANLPCVYPTPETGVKRKRGPYKKDKAPRERHLEDLVKYLEPRSDSQDHSSYPTDGQQYVSGAEPGSTVSSRPGAEQSLSPSGKAAASSRQPFTSQPKSSNSEDLVKDALIALTKSSVNDIETQADNPKNATQAARHAVSLDAGPPNSHPSARRMFEYWTLFAHRVDPLVKVIHCPSFTKYLFAAIDRPKKLGVNIETLLFSVYYAAVASCTPKEARARFGESRTALLGLYRKTIEANLSDSYGLPTIEILQALVLYLISVGRDDGDVNVRALFSLAVRMAQLTGLDEDPEGKYDPFETEIRRRLWWQICGLESRAAEEGVARQTSIMEERNVGIPSNINDIDLQPDMKEVPAPRSGIAGTSFLVLRSEIVSLSHRLWAIKKRSRLEHRNEETHAILQEQRTELERFKSKISRDLLQHCDLSRRFDWLIVTFYEAMSVKMYMIVEHPATHIPTATMTPAARLDLLQSSVQLINNTLGISKSPKLGDWGWYFRGYMQWHSVAVVIAELGRSTNSSFANNAWAVLDPVLRTWDEIFKGKEGEAAWEHVNALIERARGMRSRDLQGRPNQAPDAVASVAANHDQQQQDWTQLATYPNVPIAAWPPSQQAEPNAAISAFARNWDPVPQIYQAPEPTIAEIPAADCAMGMPGPDDLVGLGDFDNLESIDFSAFDAVFGDTTWDSSPSTDFSWYAPAT